MTPRRRNSDHQHIPPTRAEQALELLKPLVVPVVSAILGGLLAVLTASGFAWGKTPASRFAALAEGQQVLAKTLAHTDTVHTARIDTLWKVVADHTREAQPILDAMAVDLCQRLDRRTQAMIPNLNCRARLAQ